ncbi:MAG: hypothetical protein JW940_27325 [Polyangiaceae bacterium]|nr:hypothetical protein [Polyangiaceae bacterium]
MRQHSYGTAKRCDECGEWHNVLFGIGLRRVCAKCLDAQEPAGLVDAPSKDEVPAMVDEGVQADVLLNGESIFDGMPESEGMAADDAGDVEVEAPGKRGRKR